MMTGTIKNLRETFGFIRCEDGSDRFFLPLAMAPGGVTFAELRPGDRVEFEPEDHAKGARARNIRVLEG